MGGLPLTVGTVIREAVNLTMIEFGRANGLGG
jgi:hypothetical protein